MFDLQARQSLNNQIVPYNHYRNGLGWNPISALKKGVKTIYNALKGAFKDIGYAVLPDSIAEGIGKGLNFVEGQLGTIILFAINPFAGVMKLAYDAMKKKIIADMKKQLPKKLWDSGFDKIKSQAKSKAESAFNTLWKPYHITIVAESTALAGTIGGSVGTAVFPAIGTAAGGALGTTIGAIAGEVAAGVIKKALLKVVDKSTDLTFKEFEKEIINALDSNDLSKTIDTLATSTAFNFDINDIVKLPIPGEIFKLTTVYQWRDLYDKLIKYMTALSDKSVIDDQFKKIWFTTQVKIEPIIYAPYKIKQIFDGFWKTSKQGTVTIFVQKYNLQNKALSNTNKVLLLAYYQTIYKEFEKALKRYKAALKKELEARKKLDEKSILNVKNLTQITTMDLKIPKLTIATKTPVAKLVSATVTKVKAEPVKLVQPTIITQAKDKALIVKSIPKLPSPEITQSTPPSEVTYGKVASWYDSEKTRLDILKANLISSGQGTPDILNRIAQNQAKALDVFAKATIQMIQVHPEIKDQAIQGLKEEGYEGSLQILPLILAAIIAVAVATPVTANAMSDYWETEAETEQLETIIEARKEGIEIEQPTEGIPPSYLIGGGVIILGIIGGTIYLIKRKK
ncbi:hypothetical protein JW935_05940 [candidate division KSB1 bacterium]|nr:hypothetical protein [candidate division KSB1 bacterium]